MIGFKVCERARRVDETWVEAFRALPVATLSDSMARMSAGGAGLRPFYRGARMVGAAVTVKTRPGDNLIVHKALDMAQPGDIVVVDAGGDLTNAIIGELMVAHARQRRLGGLVIFGAVRDSEALCQGTLPVFALGATHRGPYKDGPGEVNVPIAINGMVIHPGDLVCGDADGVLAVPFAEVAAVCEAATHKCEAEAELLASIERGTSDRGWIDAQLRRQGCTFEP
ncbi:RraA family protein [Pseudomonas sp. NPDC007930]|uniref:RraA family protein n=1 Tax=Pseudomonas sp. NPDC007930 TaxID=3364417 RepID=UPI0036E23D48